METEKEKDGWMGKEEEEEEGRDLGVTFLKCNQPGAALLPNVNTGQRGGLTACHRDS